MCVCIYNGVNLKQPYVSGCLTLSDTLSFPTENSPSSLRTCRVFQCWSVTCLHSSCASRLASSYPPFFFSSHCLPWFFSPPLIIFHQNSWNINTASGSTSCNMSDIDDIKVKHFPLPPVCTQPFTPAATRFRLIRYTIQM